MRRPASSGEGPSAKIRCEFGGADARAKVSASAGASSAARADDDAVDQQRDADGEQQVNPTGPLHHERADRPTISRTIATMIPRSMDCPAWMRVN